MRMTRAGTRSPNVQPLEDYRIVVTKNALERLVKGFIVMYGGSYRDKVDINTTHIIGNQPSPSEKNEIRKAQDNGPQIVDPDFLLKIISDNRADLCKKARHCSPVAMAHGTVEGLDNRSGDIMEGKHVRFKVESPPPNNRVGGKAPKSNTKAEPNTEDDGKKEFENTPEKYSLYIPQDSKRAYEAKLKKSSYFYDIQVVQNSGATKFLTLTSFGRNGKVWVERSLGDGSVDDAVNKFRDTFKEKTGLDWENRNDKAQDGKYAFGNGREPVQELMQLIFNEEGFNQAKNALGYEYSLESIKHSDIERQFKTLAKDAALARKSHKNRTKAKTDKDHEILPGAGKIEVEALKPFQIQVKPLQKIWDLKNAYEIMKATGNSGKQVHLFDRQLTPLGQESKEFKTLIGYLNNYRGPFNYKLKDIFRINHEEERGGGKSKRRLLWHGSRAVNYCSILSHGLQIPPPSGPLGKMLGKGIYLTDMSSEAVRDCKTTTDALLLLCEAELPEENDTLSIMRPKKWIDAEKVHKTLKGVEMPDPTLKPEIDLTTKGPKYNTYTCYDPTQVKLRYIFRLDIGIPATNQTMNLKLEQAVSCI